MCIDHQQKATFVRNMGKLKNLPLLKTTINMHVMSTKVTEWLITIQLVGEYGSGQKKKIIFSPLGPNYME
jgi:hypothetical protein